MDWSGERRLILVCAGWLRGGFGPGRRRSWSDVGLGVASGLNPERKSTDRPGFGYLSVVLYPGFSEKRRGLKRPGFGSDRF